MRPFPCGRLPFGRFLFGLRNCTSAVLDLDLVLSTVLLGSIGVRQVS